jgi:hypothetical protein
MTRSGMMLGASEVTAEFESYWRLPETTWRMKEPAPSSAARLAIAAFAFGLSASSPVDSSVSILADLFPWSSSVIPNDAPLMRQSVSRLPSTGEQLAAVQSTFGLNKSQLADVCAVQRQTIYDWYAGKFEAEGDNARRLGELYRLVKTIRQVGIQPLQLRAVERNLPGGSTLLAMLKSRELAIGPIQAFMSQLQPASVPSKKESALAQRERLGWPALSEEQRTEQLEANIDYFANG